MKKRTIAGLLTAAVLATSMMAGCGTQKENEEKEESEKDKEDDEDEDEEDDESASSEEHVENPGASGIVYQNGDRVVVDSVEGLIESIRPGAQIYVLPGTYYLSDYLTEVWETEGESWNESHGYVSIVEEYDGPELCIWNTDNLTIAGYAADRADVEILTEPRYATLFSFYECDNVTFSCMTLGHTENGSCVGDVLHFTGGYDERLYNMDIFGCGVYGVSAESNWGLHAYDTVIRDCEYGPLNVMGDSGDWYFTKCKLTGSGGGGYFEGTDYGEMYFYNCEFGDQETTYFRYYGGMVKAVDCIWGNFITGPDSDYYPGPELDKSNLKIAPFDAAVLEDTNWYEVVVIDDVTGETLCLAACATFNKDGSGYYFNQGSSVDYSWECDSDYSAVLTTRYGGEGGLSLYYEPDTEDGTMWMYMELEGEEHWFYLMD